MDGRSDTAFRTALSKFRGANLVLYALYYSAGISLVLTFAGFVFALNSVPMVLFLQVIPVVVLIILHIVSISRSLGKANRLTKDPALTKSARYFLLGTILAIILSLAYFVLFFILPAEIYLETVDLDLYFDGAIIAAYYVIHRKAIGLLALWLSRYVEDHPSEAGKVDLITFHPKARFITLTFQAIFGETEARARAGTKLAYYATYQANPEEDEADIETKNLALEVAPANMPFHARDIQEGKCPNCGGPITGPNARYCTKCGETFKGSW